MKGGRTLAEQSPLSEPLSVFVMQWRVWWAGMQPTWRHGDWPPSRVKNTSDKDDGTWPGLARVGTCGFVLIIVSLCWWARSSRAPDLDLVQAVDDVSWVLDRMTTDLHRVPVKEIRHTRPFMDDDDNTSQSTSPYRKRPRHVL